MLQSQAFCFLPFYFLFVGVVTCDIIWGNCSTAVQCTATYLNMPKRCVAAGCNNTVDNGVSVYTFPKDEALKKKWTDQVKRTRDYWAGATVNSVLCSDHFTEDSFEESYNLHKSFGLKKYRRLKKGAVPTIFKRKATDEIDESVPVFKRPRSAYMKREQKRVS